ncbi:MAG: hypothetical protein IKE55_04095 [Kiritimatiellae bacterium]|nr:hypothetical protein [Kiritimatiellia bacterium]
MKKHMTALVCAVAALASVSPSFGEDAYIESDGSTGAGVNTGFFFGPQSKVELDCQLTDISDSVEQVRLLGAAGAQTNDTMPECEFYIGRNNGMKFSFICGKKGNLRQASNFYPIDMVRHRIVLDFYEAKQFQVWTDETKRSTGVSAFPDKRQIYPMSFFARNGTSYGATKFSSYTKMRVYRVRIWDAGVLVRDYTPLVKGGIPGFKENCSGQFVTGENIAAFTAGGDVPEEPDDPYVATPHNSPGRVTNGETIYWDTGYYFKTNSSVSLDYALMTNWAADNPYGDGGKNVLSCDGANSAGQQVYMLAYGTAGAGYYYWKTGPNGSEGGISQMSIAYANGIRRTLEMSGNSTRIITAGYTNFSKTVSSGVTVNFTKTLKLANYLPMKIYGLKIFEDGVMIKDYRPFVTNGVPGLLDVMNQPSSLITTTYGGGNKTNYLATAGGNFQDYTADVEKEAYLEFDGVSGHYINTGYVIKPTSGVEADFQMWHTVYNNQQGYFKQEASTSNPNILARLYMNSAYTYSYQFEDYSTYQTGVGVNTQISAKDNVRRQFKLDGYSNHATITCGGTVVYDQVMAKDHLNTGEPYTMRIGPERACMRLYRFKIFESGEVVRDFVPCLTNGVAGLFELHAKVFYPLTGGTVRGMGSSGVGEFLTEPQGATISHESGENSTTLTCFAPSAQSYEWYEDGVRIPGETSDSLTLTWEKSKAKISNHIHTYSVKPVYEVYNEPVKGAPAASTVDYTPFGMVFMVRWRRGAAAARKFGIIRT